MSTTACFIVIAPIMVLCAIGAALDLGARLHGGWATPTPIADLVSAVGHGARIALLAIPTALVVGVVRATRGGRR